MPSHHIKAVFFFAVIVISAGPACIRRSTSSIPNLQLSLHSGIEQVVRLNDTEEQMLARGGVKGTRSEIGPSTELGQLKFSYSYEFKEAGIRAYFRTGRVALIEIQDPFPGSIVGRRLAVFPFARREDKTWEESLLIEFGTPLEKSSGGRLSSDLLLYSWGDIAFNGLGPNQFAIYRDEDVASYRKRNFGRVIKFWN